MAALGADRAINPHVAKLLEFLQRRNLGKHGRYLESRRPPESLAPSLQE
jgi:hypothetical protein